MLAPLRHLLGKYSRLLNRPFSPEAVAADAAPQNQALGDLGEAIAARFLQVAGCKLLYRNFRAPQGGEVDIVARHGKVLAFIEVKTRTGDSMGRPALAVNLKKRRLIMRGAMAWLKMLTTQHLVWRYDVVEVLLRPGQKPEITWIQAAFSGEQTLKALARLKRR
jgi:putative endonuclease